MIGRAHVPLGEIAEAAGVSLSTASRALRDPSSVSEKSLAKIRRALAILGVEDEQSHRHAPMLGLVRPAVQGGSGDPYERLFRILTQMVFARGIVAVHGEARIGRNEALARSWLGEGEDGPAVNGAIVLGGGAAGELAARLHVGGLPVIRVSNAPHSDGIPRIVLDASRGITTAVQHLVHLGHRRIGLAVLRDSAAAARIASFRKAMASILHIPATRDQAPVVESAQGFVAGVSAAEELLGVRCTAVIACAPSLSFGVLEACRNAGLTVPRDLSLLTVGDVADADVVAPPLSQVSYDWETVAQSALAEVTVMIERPKTVPSVDYSVTPDLVLRASAVPPQRR